MSSKKLRPPKPSLPLSVFTSQPATPQTRHYPKSLIDTHVHIAPAEILPLLPLIKLPGQEIINRSHEISFFAEVTNPLRTGSSFEGKKFAEVSKQQGHEGELFEGFLYMQVEAEHDDTDVDGSKGGWDASIKEVDLLCQRALSTPSPLLIGIIPWAPVHLGRSGLELYVPKLHALPSFLEFSLQHPSKSLNPLTPVHTPSPIKAFRYWLDFAPKGFMLEENFIDGLVWLGEKGYAFDIDIDLQPKGVEVMEEVMECVKKVRESGGVTKFIIDHLAKPPLATSNESSVQSISHPFSKLISHIFELSLISDVYLKFSGLLSHVDPSIAKSAFHEYIDLRKPNESNPTLNRTESLSTLSSGTAVAVNEVTESPNLGSSALAPPPKKKGSIGQLKKSIKLILEPCLESFGDSRIVFGSDWPMFRQKLFDEKENDLAVESLCYEFELEIFRSCLVDLGVEGEGLDRIFAGNAKDFYGL